jgi:putative hydrolase of the HAD superfamily
MTIKAVFFDMDNTLFDISEIKKEAVSGAVQSMLDAGLKMEKEEAEKKLIREYFETANFYGRNVITNFLKRNKISDSRILAAGIHGYRKHKSKFMKPFPQVIETLEALKAQGLKLAIVSDANAVKVHMNLYTLGIDQYFDDVIPYEETGVRKPSKEPFMLALKRLGVKPEETIHVGDYPERDVKGANESGIISVHAVYGNVRSEPPYEDKPDYEINKFSEILGIVQELNK